MARLFTNHDPAHMHATLGVLVLLHFAFRILLVVYRGYGFCKVGQEGCSDATIRWDVASVLMHGCLSWSSLLLPVPKRRNFNSPMIWPEFRWHSIIFATRSVLAAVISILALWPEHIVVRYVAKLAFILGTCYAADTATKLLGSREKRTTNAMPYPEFMTPQMQRNNKMNYALAQFQATMACVSEDATMAWITLFAIQGAAFVMTLCRKNKITPLTLHRAYIVQLASGVNVPAVGIILHYTQCHFSLLFLLYMAHLVAARLRINLRQSKFVTYAVSIFIMNFVPYWPNTWHMLSWFQTNMLGSVLLFGFYLTESEATLARFEPLLIGESYRGPGDTIKGRVKEFITNDVLGWSTMPEDQVGKQTN